MAKSCEIFLFQTKVKDGWPSKDLIQTITSKGHGFVAKAYSGRADTKYQWRISFASSEKQFVLSLSDHQIRAYLFFKTIFRQYLQTRMCRHATDAPACSQNFRSYTI
jgi:hypothetical protein